MQPTELGLLMRGIAEPSLPTKKIDLVVTDSRRAKEGSVFVAIEGERMDGHDFVNDAFGNGAAAAVVSRPVSGACGEQIVVNDTKDAHILMAKNYKEQFSLLTAAVTGSVGKTTTKEIIAVIFERFGKTLKNEGNLNNEIGLPQTMFEIGPDTELAVFEMGMDRAGDIRKLTNAAKPDAAVITGIGLTHIEHLGSRRNILKAKLEIVEGLPKDGVLVINGDDDLLMGASSALRVKTVTFAIDNADADVTAKDIMIRPKSSEFTIVDKLGGEYKAIIPAVGHHIVMDALSAFALATRMGLEPKVAALAISDFRPAGMRQNVVDYNGVTVIEDCYNANPDSMLAMLSALSAMQIEGVRIAVLGDMLELGPLSEEEHRKLGFHAAKSGIDILLCFGENMKYTAEAARAARVTSVEWFSDKKAVADYLSKTAHAGDAVVFKASRGMMLEEVLDLFYAR
ncbi:MAG: UDP-N-acetylmuramoyl-tripeptide--D-alanyl-D-alanine ligase [Oscillospiraceae bacterium]|nr:UDP-N-acetylmuramoyl-tripeptide--D-alanyl-D-alanine ligase [Oscillospiraceae bacterium]